VWGRFAAWDNTTWAILTAYFESPEQKLITDIDSGDAARTFTLSVHKTELEYCSRCVSYALVAVTRLLAVLAHPWLGN
jgi:hypothetical protein